jgi:hypothetical protein
MYGRAKSRTAPVLPALRLTRLGGKDSVGEMFSLLTEAVDPSETSIGAVDVRAILVED